MSSYKTQIIDYFKNQELVADKILSIGNQEDDKRYFKKVICKEWLTLDFDPKFKPDFYHNMNAPVDEGSVMVKPFETFDAVIALNLFEYIWNPVVTHETIKFLLKEGGILITNYPFVYPQHKPIGTDYLRYTPEGARKILHNTGFTVIEQCAILGNENLTDFYVKDGMKTRAGTNHNITGIIIKAKKV